MDVATTFYNDRVIIGFEFLESSLITYRNEKKDHFNDNYNYIHAFTYVLSTKKYFIFYEEQIFSRMNFCPRNKKEKKILFEDLK